jgi:WD40 repeat protein
MVALSQDGKMLASASYDKTVRLGDPVRRPVGGAFLGHAGEVTDVAFSPDSKTTCILKRGADGNVLLL